MSTKDGYKQGAVTSGGHDVTTERPSKDAVRQQRVRGQKSAGASTRKVTLANDDWAKIDAFLPDVPPLIGIADEKIRRSLRLGMAILRALVAIEDRAKELEEEVVGWRITHGKHERRGLFPPAIEPTPDLPFAVQSEESRKSLDALVAQLEAAESKQAGGSTH